MYRVASHSIVFTNARPHARHQGVSNASTNSSTRSSNSSRSVALEQGTSAMFARLPAAQHVRRLSALYKGGRRCLQGRGERTHFPLRAPIGKRGVLKRQESPEALIRQSQERLPSVFSEDRWDCLLESPCTSFLYIYIETECETPALSCVRGFSPTSPLQEW
ncbi:hypothetical protein [Cynomolgus macaque cytomegalovirus strain Mauritius]|uniref:Uncharacterized protein n=1 Tax=Cynomolgus macaque cytomegalovirus strain Mauritius TaxID=1690255 RepID=A0A0K1H0J9_9BETA|nr:hypothetical protein [Cynomolgus macaque cytomegalovirus strain Mauritius]AXG21704.1 hypothetical protein [synthetic construct]AXG21972.1 hypothetical protein [synthetic construct]